MSRFRLSKEALADVREIAAYIADDNPDEAARLLDDFYGAFALLARAPAIGHKRDDLTKAPVLFWPGRTYLVIYHRDTRPVQIVAVLHGKRDVQRVLAQRRRTTRR